jgi:hypothetical protein
MGGRPLLWWKESQATCPRAAPVPTQHLNTRLHIDANRLSHRAAVFSLSTLQKYRTFFFFANIHIHKKRFPSKDRTRRHKAGSMVVGGTSTTLVLQASDIAAWMTE